MNAAAILALISDLYLQIAQLKQENAELQQRLKPPAPLPPTPETQPVETAL